MTVTAAQLRALSALGLTGDQLIAVVDVMEMRDARRDGPLTSAERSKRYRNRKRDAKRDYEGVTVRDAAPPSSSPPTTPLLTTPQNSEPKKVPRSMRGSRLSDDWRPTEDDRSFARAKGWTDEKIDSEGERFRDHAVAHGRIQKNWAAAWRNWVTSPYQARATGPPQPKPSFQDVANEQREKLNGHHPDDTAEPSFDLDLTAEPSRPPDRRS